MADAVAPELSHDVGKAGYSKEFRLAFMCILVITSHTIVSFFEEELFKRQGFNEGFFMILTMCFQYAILHTLAKPFLNKHEPSIQEMLDTAKKHNLTRSLVLLCVAYAGSNSISKMALGFVSIPTQIVFKSCKLVAVMIGSYAILGRKYAPFEFFVASLLVAGMVCFAGGDMKDSVGEVDMNTIIGCSILVVALFCDSVLGNMQEKVQKGGLCDELSLMYLQSIFGVILLTVWTGLTGELQTGIRKCFGSVTVFACLNAWSILNMFGIVIMLKVAGEFSAVTSVLVSSCRKFVSLVVSYTFFPKPLTFMHGCGMVFVFGAIFLHTWWKRNNKKSSSTSAGQKEKEVMSGVSMSEVEEGRKMGDGSGDRLLGSSKGDV